TIIRHSEGSLIGIIAAQRGGVDRVVSIAGPGATVAEDLITQLASKLPPDLMQKSRDIIASLKAGKTVDAPPPELGMLFRPSVQPYLISLFRYDPVQEVAKLRVPVLVLQGTTDIQVPVDDAKRLAGKSAKLV